jgi:ABC-type bacteriocin/lantibiotic exporter with double-glycine peptidase domain
VLDEATSALDGATEGAFFQALRAELKDCTVISITHRLTTTQYFDRIYKLEGGFLAGELPTDTVAEADAVNAGP